MDSHILNSTSSKGLESRNASEYAKRESWPCVVNVQHNRNCVFCHFAKEKMRENASTVYVSETLTPKPFSPMDDPKMQPDSFAEVIYLLIP